MKEAEEEVKAYFLNAGLRCDKIPEGKTKTPDFKIFREENLLGFCEVKAIIFDNWLLEDIKSVPCGTLVVGSRKDPILNRLGDDVCKAAKQFVAYDKDRTVPRVLAFVNYDTVCDISDLTHAVTGNFYAEDGSVHSLYKKVSEGRIKKAIGEIDLCLWLNRNQGFKLSISDVNEDKKEFRWWVTHSSQLPELAKHLKK